MSHSPPVNLFISFMARGKGGFLNPFPSKRSLPPWFTTGWGNSVPGLVKILGTKRTTINLWRPKHVPYPFYTRCVNVPKHSRCSWGASALNIPGKSSPRARGTSHPHNNGDILRFLFFLKQFLGAHCKVMVYFWTSAWLWNEGYLNDEGVND